jgi:hypothetical protein
MDPAAARIWLDQREAKTTTPGNIWRRWAGPWSSAAVFSELFEERADLRSAPSATSHGALSGRLGPITSCTPVGGVLWTMGEDAIDKYVLARMDTTRHIRRRESGGANDSESGADARQPGAEPRAWYRSDRPIALSFAIGR